MKKTLVAVAVLGAFAGSALAADVTLYGVIDTGVNWTQTKGSGFADATKNVTTNSFSMGTGQNSGSRFGLKGTEDLGDGWKVGFNLENSFKSDTGALESAEDGGRLFHREALLFVQSPYGELSMGRTGALDAGTGRYNLMGSGATAMGTGWDVVGKSTLILKGTGSRMDNTVTYQSPSFAGLTVYAQASLKKDSCDPELAEYEDDNSLNYKEGSSDAERYYALGAKFSAEGLNAGLVFSTTDYSRYDVTKANDDNGYVVSGFVNYDFGMVKPMLAAQYWNGGDKLTHTWNEDDSRYDNDVNGTKGYGIVIGATAPVLGGTLKVTGGWNDFEDAADNSSTDYNNWMIGAGYEYSLSKRTMIYTATGYSEAKTEKAAATTKTKTSEVMVGLVHKF